MDGREPAPIDCDAAGSSVRVCVLTEFWWFGKTVADSRQGVFTSVAHIRPGAVEAVRHALAVLDSAAEIASGIDLPQHRLPGPRARFEDLTTTHYLRWVIFPEATDATGDPIGPQLCFSSCYDAPLGPHLEEVVRAAWPAIRDAYEWCEGFESASTPAALVAYLLAGEEKRGAWYGGSPGRSLGTVRDEAALRACIEVFLDSRRWDGNTALEVRAAIQEFVLATPELRWALAAPAKATAAESVRRFLPLAAVIAGVLAVWPGIPLAAGRLARTRLGLSRPLAEVLATVVGLGPLAAWLARLRYHETHDLQAGALVPDHVHLVEVEVEEDWGAQNQFTKLVNVKPGPFRLNTLRVFLFATNLCCRYLFVHGQLAGIRSIHFANWTFVDGGRRLLFFSNFDGSWENYLSEFIDGSGRGLTAIYSQTAGFPTSRWLFWGGTQDEQRYKALVRNAQLATEVWYRAYDRLSVENVNNNSAIRAGLWRAMNEREAQAWLNRL